jgi:predicted transcriptional regulator
MRDIKMLSLCEVIVKSLLPSLRALMAKYLITKYNLNQVEAARILGVSQSAISLYIRKMRGKSINLEEDVEIKKLVEKIVDSLINKNLTHRDFIIEFCKICQITRSKGLLCNIHKTFDPIFEVENCQICMLKK